MTACAADDLLNLIATTATSDGGTEKIAPPTPSAALNIGNGNGKGSRAGRPSSSVHLWDAEMMTLMGTLLLPCLHLTRDLANVETAFGMSSVGRATAVRQSPNATAVEAPVQSLMGEAVAVGGSTPSVVGERTQYKGLAGAFVLLFVSVNSAFDAL